MTQRLKVVYLAGSGRSGSTLFDNVLGELPGYFSAGELRFVWDRNVRDDRVCGCGEPFSRCTVWQSVLQSAYGTSVPDPTRVLAWRERALPLRVTPLVGLPTVRRRLAARYAPYLAVLEKLYHSVAHVTGAQVVVDSSKYPSYGYLLSLIDSLDVVMVHLVRDPRAVAHSWTRTRLETTVSGVQTPMGYIRPARTAIDWMLWSVLAERYGRALPHGHQRVRYEDFVAGYPDVAEQVLHNAGLPSHPLPPVTLGGIHLSGNHTVGGNPSRLRRGAVPLRLDDEWRSTMRPRDRWAVTALTLPGIVGYRYARGVT